jgi:REP element-mobilizing transposase RayT
MNQDSAGTYPPNGAGNQDSASAPTPHPHSPCPYRLTGVPHFRILYCDRYRNIEMYLIPINIPCKGDEFIVMPDHIHFILHLHPDHTHRPTLSTIVNAYKSLTARAALSHLKTRGDVCGKQFWQQRFYDHIICNETELQAIRTYIRNNPLNAGHL